MPLTSSGQISCSVLPFDTTTTLTSAAPTSTPAHISLDCCLGWLMILWVQGPPELQLALARRLPVHTTGFSMTRRALTPNNLVNVNHYLWGTILLNKRRRETHYLQGSCARTRLESWEPQEGEATGAGRPPRRRMLVQWALALQVPVLGCLSLRAGSAVWPSFLCWGACGALAGGSFAAASALRLPGGRCGEGYWLVWPCLRNVL